MKKILAASFVAAITGAALYLPSGVALADPVPRVPACTVYNSAEEIPFSAYCEAYKYNGTTLTPAISVNGGTP